MSDTKYLLDTNTISETRKTRPNANVMSFFSQISPEQTFLSVLTVGELWKGTVVYRQRHSVKNYGLTEWIEALETDYVDRLLGIDLEVTRLWGMFSGQRTRPVVDTLLAATALQHRLVLVTRNTKDVYDIPVRTLNPWLRPV